MQTTFTSQCVEEQMASQTQRTAWANAAGIAVGIIFRAIGVNLNKVNEQMLDSRKSTVHAIADMTQA
jgi:hypothetical protein